MAFVLILMLRVRHLLEEIWYCKLTTALRNKKQHPESRQWSLTIFFHSPHIYIDYICAALCDLVPFVQLKTCNFTRSITPPWVFSRFSKHPINIEKFLKTTFSQNNPEPLILEIRQTSAFYSIKSQTFIISSKL